MLKFVEKKTKLPPPRKQEDNPATPMEKPEVPPRDKGKAPKKDKPSSMVRDCCVMCMNKIIFLSFQYFQYFLLFHINYRGDFSANYQKSASFHVIVLPKSSNLSQENSNLPPNIMNQYFSYLPDVHGLYDCLLINLFVFFFIWKYIVISIKMG